MTEILAGFIIGTCIGIIAIWCVVQHQWISK